MPVFLLDDDELWFPDPHLGEEDDGFIAVGGDLRPERLILAYENGFFPWFPFKEQVFPSWHCPLRRFVIFPKEIHVSHSMRTLLNKGRYEVTFNRAFGRVIRECAGTDGRDGNKMAWLGPDIIKAYTTLHDMGLAASVEVWDKEVNTDDPALVGGLYGVMTRNAFFGESMFSKVPSGSKLALIYLARKAEREGWHFIDCQFETPHLKSMGGRHISYEEYMDMISRG